MSEAPKSEAPKSASPKRHHPVGAVRRNLPIGSDTRSHCRLRWSASYGAKLPLQARNPLTIAVPPGTGRPRADAF